MLECYSGGKIKLPRFELTSYSGTQVASETLGGKATILTILDAQCTDVCPIIASVVAGAIDRLTPRERREVKALGITGDPAEDTPRAVRQSWPRGRRSAGSTTCSGVKPSSVRFGPHCRSSRHSTAARTLCTPLLFASTTVAASG